MKSIRNLVLVALTALAVGGLQADTLYWQVDTGAADAYSGYDKSSVDGATLYKVATEGATRPYEDATEVSGYVKVENGKTGVLGADIGTDGSTYSFFVELYNASGDVVWTQYASTYQQLLDSGYISTGGITTPAEMATGGMNGASVPEPTSGVLLLIGGAMLALRRRRRV